MQRFTGHPASASTMSSIDFTNVGFHFKDSAVNSPLWPGRRSDLDSARRYCAALGYILPWSSGQQSQSIEALLRDHTDHG